MKIFPPNLPPGSSGAAVLLLQLGLIAAGLGDGIIPDGKYDEVTTSCVRSLQEKLGIEPTGVFDAATRAALKAQRGLDVDLLEHEDFLQETLLPDAAEQQQLAGVAG